MYPLPEIQSDIIYKLLILLLVYRNKKERNAEQIIGEINCTIEIYSS